MKRALILMVLTLFLIGFVFAVAQGNAQGNGNGGDNSGQNNENGQTYSEDELAENSDLCNVDSDCQVKFNACSCKNICTNIYNNDTMTCARACTEGESDKSIQSCQCVENKCEGVKGGQNKNIVQEKNRLKFEAKTGQECPENCTCTGVVVKCELGDGVREMTVYAQSGNIIVISKNGENATTTVTLYHHNKSLYGVFKNNETKEIKILPDEVKEKIRERVRNRIIEHFNITLDEDGFYKIQAQKKARLFYLMPVKEKVRAQINAENGEIVRVRNPWWGFLARDVRE